MTEDDSQRGRTFRLLCLLWLTGVSMRVTILAVPPVIPLIHTELHLSEAQVGLLVSLPLLLFALAAVPGALLVHRLGTFRTLLIGIVITAVAGAGRGGAANAWTLFAATFVMGFGVAIMQPALPALVREWLPRRIALGAATSTNGLVMGGMLAPAFTAPFILPLVGDNWRYALIAWTAPVLVTAVAFVLFAPRTATPVPLDGPVIARWWPDWKSPLLWLLGLTFGSNNAMYYGTNAFVPDYPSQPGTCRSGRTRARVPQWRAARRLAAAATGRRPAAALACPALSGVRSDLVAGGSRPDVVERRVGGGVGRHHRVFDRRDVRRDAGLAATAEPTGRRASHRRRHVHDQLQLRRDRADAERRLVGHDRRALDRVHRTRCLCCGANCPGCRVEPLPCRQRLSFLE